MFIRVQWPNFNNRAPFHFYECHDYYGSWVEDPNRGCSECTPCKYFHLDLDNGKHEVDLDKGCIAFIMNNEGKTIDKLCI